MIISLQENGNILIATNDGGYCRTWQGIIIIIRKTPVYFNRIQNISYRYVVETAGDIELLLFLSLRELYVRVRVCVCASRACCSLCIDTSRLWENF